MTTSGPDPVSLEQRVAAVILEWDREHTESRAAEVIALCRGAIADDLEAAGRKDVGWLAQFKDERQDVLRTVVAEDTWRAAIRVVGGPLEPRSEK